MPTEIADAIATVVGKATEAIRANEEGSRQGGDIEHVHQMRVATRRIRAYLKAARPVLDGDVVTTLRDDLSALAATLGAVRDLDVMIDRMHREAAALGKPDTAALERLIGSLDAERDSDRLALVAVLDRPDYQDMLAELDSAAADPPVDRPVGRPDRSGRRRVAAAGPGQAQAGRQVRRAPAGRRPARVAHLR